MSEYPEASPPLPRPSYISLAAAAKRSPGTPHVSAVWRWCRRGVLSRTGERIRLKHIRAGGKILTTPQWVEEFCHALAAADQKYFEARDAAGRCLAPRDEAFAAPKRKQWRTPAPRTSPTAPSVASQRSASDALDAELDAEGL